MALSDGIDTITEKEYEYEGGSLCALMNKVLNCSLQVSTGTVCAHCWTSTFEKGMNPANPSMG